MIYVIYLIFSGEWREMIPKLSSIKDAWFVLLHDLHIRKKKPDQGKYNAAQRLAYTGIVFMGFGSLLTGLVIYKPVEFSYLTTLLGGYEAARFQHFLLTIGFLLFFVIHILQVILAGWNNFRSVVTGWEVKKDESVSEKEKENGR